MSRSRKLAYRALLLLVCCVLLSSGSNGDAVSEINKGISSGNAQLVSSYLASTVEMNILGHVGYYSKLQANLVLTDFFKNNPPKNYDVRQGGSSSENTKFCIGTYTSTTNSFKIYYVVKKDNNLEKINKLTIEKR